MRTKDASKQTGSDQSTRDQLLEVAGQVFAEKGFDRATGKEICERARANTAAVNYYFQGTEGLYVAVLCKAHSRMLNFEALSAAIAGKEGAKAKLQAFIGLFVKALTHPATTSWELRVIGREIVAPSPALDELREREILPKLRIIRGIVSELMELPEDHPAVARGCVSVVAPCFMLLVADRRTIKALFPSFGFTPDDADVLARHLVDYAMAGLTAVAKDVQKPTSTA